MNDRALTRPSETMPRMAVPSDSQLRVLPSEQSFPDVRLIEPSTSGFALLAAEVDRRPPMLGSSLRSRQLLAECKELSEKLRRRSDVYDVAVFRAVVVPLVGGAPYLQRRREPVHRARFDVAILVEADSLSKVEEIQRSATYVELERRVRSVSRFVYQTAATNVKRIATVDHSRDGVFLFNFFVADRREQNIAVWHYTAGWFQQETGLDNSTVLLPAPGSASEYTLINHCRWDRLRDVLPSLIFKRSFRNYVLAHFDVNDTAPMPVLYRLA